MDLVTLLRALVEAQGSDLLVKVGSAPTIRRNGVLERTSFEAMTPAELEELVLSVLPQPRASELAQAGSTDVAYSVSGLGRFRVNVYRQRGTLGLVARWVRPGIPTLAQLGLPDGVRRLAEARRGLVLVVGPSGSGRTTTVAALLDHVNATRAAHIVTIEDPIEYLHPDKQAIVSQREVGTDVRSFREGAQRVLRQDADVVFVGELRDVDTVDAAVEAARGDRLVVSILTCAGPDEALARVLEFWPPQQQRQSRQALATVLQGIVAQRLVPRRDGKGRVAATEVLVRTPRVVELVSDPERYRGTLDEVIAEGTYHGMHALDASLLELVRVGAVDLGEAMAASEDPEDLRAAAASEGLLAH